MRARFSSCLAFSACLLVASIAIVHPAFAAAPPADDDAITPPPVGEPDGKAIPPPADGGSPHSMPGSSGPEGVPPVPVMSTWTYQPRYGLQMGGFLATHPSDTYVGILLAAHLHVMPQISISGDLRIAGGNDDDGDLYVSSLISLGGSVYYWLMGSRLDRALQPYARFGVGHLWITDERFDDGSDDDLDKRRYKKNGVPADGHSDTSFSEAVGLRLVLVPTSTVSEVGLSFDVEFGLHQDMHYGLSDSGIMFTVGFSFFH